MYPRTQGGRVIRSRHALFMAASAAIAATCSASHAQVTLTKNSNSNWTINNGPLSVVFNPGSEDITSIQLTGNGASSPNLLGGSTPELDQEFAGTPFGSGPQTFQDQIGPNNSYVDVWTNVASTGTTVNPITYAFHYVLFANDPTVYCYEALSHASTDPATSVGQGQFLFRSNPSLFPNLYQINTGPNQLGTANAQTTIGIPSTNANFSTVTAQAGRTVQNVTYDLTGSGIAGDNGTNFFTKYDYSVYSQFFQAETMYGGQYAVTEVDTAPDTLTGGPTKQELAWTDPGILNMEFLSDHYGIDGPGNGAYPGYAYYPTQGANTSKLFGPYAFTISSASSATAAQINQNAINAIPNDVAEFNTDTELASAGYVNTAARGSVQINAANSAGWSSNTANNTVVLSDPGKNFQESTQGYQYTGQISQNGTVNIPNVVPGDYRMTLYQLGQWGETRVEGVQVQNGQVTILQGVKFTPENFSTSAPIWTIGTPNRSSNEFMNGHTSTGTDQRQYYGAYDFWAEEQALGTPGYVSYNATATTIGGVQEPATNNPNAWIANQWYTFDPQLYDSTNGTSDNYNNTAPTYVKNAGGPASYHGAPWQVHFTTTQAQQSQGQFVVISVAVVALDASLTLTLNGHAETWGYNNFAPDDPMIRSGDAGFYQWAAFQFPTTDLESAGIANDNELQLSVSAHTDGVMYDALRMEITNISANPSVTGWDDYTFISTSNSSQDIAPNDAFGISTLTWNNAGGTGNGTTWDNGVNQNWSNGVAESTFSSGVNVVFNDSNNSNYNVTLNSPVNPLSILFNNSAGNYVVSGTGSIIGSAALAKYGTGSLTLNTVNTYTGGTNVYAGTLIAGVSGALPLNNDAIALIGGTIQANAIFTVGSGSTFTQTGGAADFNDGLFINGGAYNISAGTLSAINTLDVGEYTTGTFNMGSGNVTASFGAVGDAGTGTFTQTGGTLTILNALSVGLQPGSTGAFYANGGVTTVQTGAYLGGSYLGVGGSGVLNVGGGNVTIDGALTIFNQPSTGLTVSAGSLAAGSISNAATISQSGGTISTGALSGTGTVALTAGTMSVTQFTQGSISIAGTGKLAVAPNSNFDNSVASLSITGTAELDLANNHMFIDYGSGPDPIASVAALIKSGYNGGAWNGPGIASSVAAITPGYSLGYADAADPGNPAGLSSGTIEIKYTLLGDADLSGVVDGTDFGIVAANFNKGVSGWDQGDFNYDNVVDGTDFADLAANFNKGANGASVGGSALTDPALVAFAEAHGLMADVPEPTLGGLLVMGLVGIISRRSRKTNTRHHTFF